MRLAHQSGSIGEGNGWMLNDDPPAISYSFCNKHVPTLCVILKLLDLDSSGV
jgi:hypothetical protein